MTPNFLVIALTALIPFVLAMAYYSPFLFGGDNWQKIANLTDEQNNKKVKPWQLALTLLLNFFFAFGLYNLCVHQAGVFQLVGGDVELMMTGTARAFLDEYGLVHLSFGHGALHGVLAVIMFVLPVFSYVTIFDRKSGKYLLVRMGFWLICGALMGGVICQWGWNLVV